MYFLGIDVGSSSVKLALLDGENGACLAQLQKPDTEFAIDAPHSGWAEQSPEMWWQATLAGMQEILQQVPEAKHRLSAIGISYQMHGLVALDKNHHVVCPSIIWCDSRAESVGERISVALQKQKGENWCDQSLLNNPGNFTFSKLLWLAENQPAVFEKIKTFVLPGDYIAFRLSGVLCSSDTGMSEGMLWHFKENRIAKELFSATDLSADLLPDIIPAVGEVIAIDKAVADFLGLSRDVVLTYRAGDQVNNAISLNVMANGELAATAGTSGVVYAVTDQLISDPQQRVNSFLHASTANQPTLVGLLGCVNGAGSINSWLKRILQTSNENIDYETLSRLAATAPVGSDGLTVMPFGNGSERMFPGSLQHGAMITGLDLNRHGLQHLSRAIQESVAYAMGYCVEVFTSIGLDAKLMRAGSANMFLSSVFSQSLANITNLPIELYQTNGALGAAAAAGWGAGFYTSRTELFANVKVSHQVAPNADRNKVMTNYEEWKTQLLDHYLVR